MFRLHKKRSLKGRFCSKWTLAFLQICICSHYHQQCKIVPVSKGGLAAVVSTWEWGTREKNWFQMKQEVESGDKEKAVSDRVKRGQICLWKRRLSLPPVALKKNVFSYSYLFYCNDCHAPSLFARPWTCVQMQICAQKPTTLATLWLQPQTAKLITAPCFMLLYSWITFVLYCCFFLYPCCSSKVCSLNRCWIYFIALRTYMYIFK